MRAIALIILILGIATMVTGKLIEITDNSTAISIDLSQRNVKGLVGGILNRLFNKQQNSTKNFLSLAINLEMNNLNSQDLKEIVLAFNTFFVLDKFKTIETLNLNLQHNAFTNSDVEIFLQLFETFSLPTQLKSLTLRLGDNNIQRDLTADLISSLSSLGKLKQLKNLNIQLNSNGISSLATAISPELFSDTNLTLNWNGNTIPTSQIEREVSKWISSDYNNSFKQLSISVQGGSQTFSENRCDTYIKQLQSVRTSFVVYLDLSCVPYKALQSIVDTETSRLFVNILM